MFSLLLDCEFNSMGILWVLENSMYSKLDLISIRGEGGKLFFLVYEWYLVVYFGALFGCFSDFC